MNRKTILINSALGLTALALAGGTVAVVGSANRTSAVSGLRTVAVTRASLQELATATGNVSAGGTVGITAGNCTGPVTSIQVAVGQKVSAGTVLLQIDPTSAKNALQAAQAQVDSAAAQQNQQAVQAGNSVSQAQLQLRNAQQTQSLDAQQASAAVATAQKQLATDTATLSQAQSTASANPNSQQDANAVTAAQGQVTKDQQSLTQAQNQQANQTLKDQQQVDSAGQSLGSAQNSASSQSSASGESAQTALTTAQNNLAACTVKATSSGTVTNISAVVGVNASSGSSGGSSSSSAASTAPGLVTLSDTGHLQVAAAFSEADVASIKAGQSATFTFPALTASGGTASQTPVNGKVESIAASAVITNGVVTYSVTIGIDNPPSALRLGQSATVSVQTASVDNALVVPTLAITSTGTRQTVTVDRDGSQQTVAITTGITANGRTQVLTGLNEGDSIVLPSVTTPLTTTTQNGRTGTGGFGGGGGTGGFGGGAGGGARNGG
ncbi:MULTISPECIES: HlyD family efflux transporter periplasmic adaptor subunit [Arthrobacter]|uniref:HlyD family efflux transporter periplasmic adaptor subunit n=2 Tax=Arthrobacter TaxID=1663 RepID=A0ABU9KPV8_9MICC|nr:HlyD family efflux transporter periplasmic adaptor subunit [Arthrobacter sp. YJM1]MDP5228341.1 HlyD family efflux transporter periplasmic adaptor subunit [Arthrobacter sp. YJM1]